VSGCVEGVDAVAGEFVRGDVVAYGSRFDGVGDQVSDHGVELPLGLVDLWVAVEQVCELSSVCLVVMVSNSLLLDVGVGGEDGL